MIVPESVLIAKSGRQVRLPTP